jgi:glycosyltransferase involved in cell wall biosynthesis
LEDKLKKENICMVYLFPKITENLEWVQEMRNLGETIYFFSENRSETMKTILEVVKKHNIGILHTHFWWDKRLLLIKLITFGKVKIIRHFHNTATGLSLKANNKIRAFVKTLIRYIACRISDLIVGKNCACGEGVYKDLLLYYSSKKCCFVENKIDFARFKNDKNDKNDRNDRKKYYGFENNVVCSIFGNHFDRKGCDIAIKALSPITHKYNIILIIICMEQVFAEISQKVMEVSVGVPDWVKLFPTAENIEKYYTMSDIFLSPSRDEGFVYAIPEAIYCGSIPIRSDLPTTDWRLPYDMVVPCEDSEALREKVEYIITSLLGTEKLITMLEKNKEYVVKNFSIDSWSEEILALYKEFL